MQSGKAVEGRHARAECTPGNLLLAGTQVTTPLTTNPLEKVFGHTLGIAVAFLAERPVEPVGDTLAALDANEVGLAVAIVVAHQAEAVAGTRVAVLKEIMIFLTCSKNY